MAKEFLYTNAKSFSATVIDEYINAGVEDEEEVVEISKNEDDNWDVVAAVLILAERKRFIRRRP